MPLTHYIADIPVVLRLAGTDREPCLTPEGGPLDRATPDHRKLLAGLQDRVAAALAGGWGSGGTGEQRTGNGERGR